MCFLRAEFLNLILLNYKGHQITFPNYAVQHYAHKVGVFVWSCNLAWCINKAVTILCRPPWMLGPLTVPVRKARGRADEFCLEPWLPCKVNQLAGIPSIGEIQIGKMCCFLIVAFSVIVLLHPFHCEITPGERYKFILSSTLVISYLLCQRTWTMRYSLELVQIEMLGCRERVCFV